jgi:hypothetical protein
MKVSPVMLGGMALIHSSDLGDATTGNAMMSPEQSAAMLEQQKIQRDQQQHQQATGLINAALPHMP